MTITLSIIDAFCAAIDAGDDSLLPILADLLEETGDARAAGLRAVCCAGQATHNFVHKIVGFFTV